jgi:hypothetical protein
MRHFVWLLSAVLLSSPIHPSLAQGADSEDRLVTQQAASWREIKQGLTGPNGDKFWEAMMGAVVPAGAFDVRTLRGTVVSSKPAEHPSELVLALSDDRTPEVTLKLFDEDGKSTGLKMPLAPGTTVEFGGIARRFEREPFMLTFEVELGLDRDIGLWIFRRDNSKEQQK